MSEQGINGKSSTKSFFLPSEGAVSQPSFSLGILKNRGFFLLWLSQAISNFGDWLVVSSLLALVYSLTAGSSAAVGVLMIFKIAPALLLGPLAGQIADRFNRKTIMIVCDLVRAALVLLLPFSTSIYQVYLITFLMEAFSLFFVPAKDASIPNVVKREELSLANSFSYATTQLTMLIGLTSGATILLIVRRLVERFKVVQLPLLGKVASHFVGPHATFVIDSATFIFSAFILFFVSLPGNKKKSKEEAGESIFSFNLSYFCSYPRLQVMIKSLGLALIGGGSLLAVGVAFTEQVLGAGREGVSPILAILAGGMFVGSFFVTRMEKYFELPRQFAAFLFLFSLSYFFFSFISYYWVTVICSFFAGVSLSGVWISGYTYIHQKVADEERGRVFAALEMVIRVCLILSLIFSGFFADLIGIRQANFFGYQLLINGSQVVMVFGAILILVASLNTWFTIIREE